VSLFQIDRGENTLLAPRATTTLMADDILFFSGLIEDMQQVFNFDGISPASSEVFGHCLESLQAYFSLFLTLSSFSQATG